MTDRHFFNNLLYLMFFLMCVGFDGFDVLDPFEDFDDLLDLEAFCFFVLLDGAFRWFVFSGLAESWERESGLDGDLDDGREAGRDGGSDEGSLEVAEVESLPSRAFSVPLWALAGRS